MYLVLHKTNGADAPPRPEVLPHALPRRRLVENWNSPHPKRSVLLQKTSDPVPVIIIFHPCPIMRGAAGGRGGRRASILASPLKESDCNYTAYGLSSRAKGRQQYRRGYALRRYQHSSSSSPVAMEKFRLRAQKFRFDPRSSAAKFRFAQNNSM